MLEDKDLLALQEVRTKVGNAYAAWQTYRSFTQTQVDTIIEAMGEAARREARRLAEMAVEETGYGNADDKLTKNLLAADLLPRTLRGMKTVGVIREDREKKIIEIAAPIGVIAAILPTTNPTSTAIYKILISLKAGNAIVLSPHPRAYRCTCETAEVVYQAARQAGAPENIIQCVTGASLEATQELMRHRRTGAILSTGGSGIVKAAYSSGKPAYGVGPGNVPVLIDTSACVEDAVAKVVQGKSFDFGTVCSSEQAVVAERSLREPITRELKARGAYFCTPEQTAALAKLLLTPQFTVNPNCVGQPAPKIARMAGFDVPAGTPILVVELGGIGKEHPLSAEKLSPVLSLFFVENFAAALDACESILRFGGLGHTCVIHAKDDGRIREYALRMPAMRVLANTPAPQGSTGITTNVFPAMTLGCGAVAGNSTGDNISPMHLLNIKRLAYASRRAEDAFETPKAPARAAAAGGSDMSIDRRTISDAVERYLAQRGAGAPAAASSASAEIVDRFLSARRTASVVAPGPPAPPAPAGTPAAAPAQPQVKIADFVCENDVRQAIQKSAKIFVGPRTIVTPAARDLAGPHGVLVPAQRP